MLGVYSLTILLSAGLLFLVEPMFAKMVLPRLGGTPAVWNTCMVFYQATLLGGYLYAHFSARLLGTRRQAAWHMVVLALPILVLPIVLSESQVPPAGANPIPWLLAVMAVSVGLPFFAVSASAPMLQAWFADTGHPAGKDPYFLYAASNLGSLAALLSYPTLVEPHLSVVLQSRLWEIGYGLLALLTIGCAMFLWRSRGPDIAAARGSATGVPDRGPEAGGIGAAEAPAAPSLKTSQRLHWLALAFAPSSLMLGKKEIGYLGLGALLALVGLNRPLQFGMSIGAVLLAANGWFFSDAGVIHQERSFFGVLRVREHPLEHTRMLIHGSTVHGVQSLETERRQEPMAYFQHDGPLGEVFDQRIDPQKHRHIGVIGLGTGTVAAYAQPGQEFTFFEIDPSVVRISDRKIAGSANDCYFTYTRDARLRGNIEVNVILGDARQRLVQQPSGHFDLLVVDAFSSDAIPIHLLTKEALELYFDKLAPEGILLAHVSNRYLKLAPVLGNLARQSGLSARLGSDEGDVASDRYGSEWVAVVRSPERLAALLKLPGWEEIAADDTVGLWTDDFSNILGVLTWWRHSTLGRWMGCGE